MDKKQNTGHWITMYESKNMVACSKCNKCAYLYNGRTSAYCPHCGDYKGQAQADGDIITALCSLPKIISEDGQDYVQLADVLETVRRYKPSVAIPPAEPKTEQFAKWVATEIFDDMWEYNKDAFAEIACRKLEKLGIVRAKGDEWELIEEQERSDRNDSIYINNAK